MMQKIDRRRWAPALVGFALALAGLACSRSDLPQDFSAITQIPGVPTIPFGFDTRDVTPLVIPTLAQLLPPPGQNTSATPDALGSSWLATRIEPRQHDFPTASAAVAVLPVAPPPAEVAVVPLSEPAPRSIPRVSETPAGSAMVASGQPGSFETGTLQGWQLPETRLDFEDGRVGPLASNPGA